MFFTFIVLRAACCGCCREPLQFSHRKDAALADMLSLLGCIGLILYQVAITLNLATNDLIVCHQMDNILLRHLFVWFFLFGVLFTILPVIIFLTKLYPRTIVDKEDPGDIELVSVDIDNDKKSDKRVKLVSRPNPKDKSYSILKNYGHVHH